MEHNASTHFVVRSRQTMILCFMIIMLVATILPFPVGWFLTSEYVPETTGKYLFGGALVLAAAHQAASFILYTDKDARPIFINQWKYFFIAPLFIFAGTGLFFLYADVTVESYFWTFFAMVTIYHYQKQNMGIYGLVSPILGPGRMGLSERRLIMAGGLAGILVFGYPINRTIFQDTIFYPLENVTSALGFLVFIATALYGVYYSISQYRQKKKTVRQLILLLILATYYWPLFFIEDPSLAFFMFACGHGFQYLAMLGFTRLNGKTVQNKIVEHRIQGLLVAAGSFVFLIVFTSVIWDLWMKIPYISLADNFGFDQVSIGSALAGLVIGVTLIHYWIDSRIWKMSMADSRKFIQTKFNFLF